MWTIGAAEAGKRLDAWLARQPEVGSRARASDWIERGKIFVGGRQPQRELCPVSYLRAVSAAFLPATPYPCGERCNLAGSVLSLIGVVHTDFCQQLDQLGSIFITFPGTKTRHLFKIVHIAGWGAGQSPQRFFGDNHVTFDAAFSGAIFPPIAQRVVAGHRGGVQARPVIRTGGQMRPLTALNRLKNHMPVARNLVIAHAGDSA